MINPNVYREVKAWKKPLHVLRTQLAKSYLKLLPNVEVIGITGSVGKTLTQNAIYSVLSQKFKTIVGTEDLDPTFRIPQTILAAKPWDQKMILEYGVEHPGDMDHYLSLVKPRITIVTAITPTHTKYFKNEEGVYQEKLKIVKALGKNDLAVLNADDPFCLKMADQTQAKIWWYGKKAKDGIKISHFSSNLKGAQFPLHSLGQKATVRWKIIGQHQLLSAYAAATVGIICSLTLKQVAKGLSITKPPVHRLNAIVTKHLNVIDDTYNASPKAAQEAVNTLLDLGKRQKKIAVFGEMKDLGSLSKEAHTKLGGQIARSKINYLLTIGKIAKVIAQAAKKAQFGGEIINVSSTDEAINDLKKIVSPKTLILIKGSRHAHLERIVLGLMHTSTKITCYHCG